jgi:hypothetical protein
MKIGDAPMKRAEEDPDREDRINFEAIADAHDPEEQVMGWWSYLDDKITFPFMAKCTARKAVSPLRNGDPVEVHGLAPEDVCTVEMLVMIRWHGRAMAVPLSQLAPDDVDDSTAEAIADWHYWVARGYTF